MMRRYDVYGFRNPSLEEAAAFVESALGIRLMRRDSSYRGIYYCAGEGVAHDYLLQTNDEEARWHSQYPQYGVTLMVNNFPDMDVIRERLTSGRSDPAFLHSIIRSGEPPDEYPPDDEDG
jgi:hypothetical protein